ncbi:hypothetical protein GCM10010327_61420 [Streptomyces nitrosporeus]|nr:hypothetical protein GCM10010327_61420 [Streptomyces nitrosporeus]
MAAPVFAPALSFGSPAPAASTSSPRFSTASDAPGDSRVVIARLMSIPVTPPGVRAAARTVLSISVPEETRRPLGAGRYRITA